MRRDAKEDGFALIGALWLALALGLIGSLSLAIAQRAVVRAELVVDEAAEQLIQDGAAIRALQELGASAEHVAPVERAYEIGGRKVTVELRPARAWPDLNRADAPTLAQVLGALGAEPDRAARLADTIADWREADGLRRLNAATAGDYESAGLPPPRGGPFEHPGELALVAGLTREDAECLAGWFTTVSETAEIDPAVAAVPVAGENLELAAVYPALSVRWTATVDCPGCVPKRGTALLTGAVEEPVYVFEWGRFVQARSTCLAPDD